jgi:hypothetical protein
VSTARIRMNRCWRLAAGGWRLEANHSMIEP